MMTMRINKSRSHRHTSCINTYPCRHAGQITDEGNCVSSYTDVGFERFAAIPIVDHSVPDDLVILLVMKFAGKKQAYCDVIKGLYKNIPHKVSYLRLAVKIPLG